MTTFTVHDVMATSARLVEDVRVVKDTHPRVAQVMVRILRYLLSRRHSSMGRRVRHRDGKDDTRKFRDIVFERDGHKCVWCGRTLALCIYHIIAISIGGQNTLDNMQTLCDTCGHVKANRIVSIEEGRALLEEPRWKKYAEYRNKMIDIYGRYFVKENSDIRRLLRLIRGEAT